MMMLERMKTHSFHLSKANNTGAHASAYRKAKKKYYRVLCDLDEHACGGHGQGVAFLVEQLMIIMFGTYTNSINGTSKMNLGDHANVAGNTVTEALAAWLDEVTETTKEDDGEDESEDESELTGSTGNAMRNKKTALLKYTSAISVAYEKLGNETCSQMGWQPSTSRADFSSGSDVVGRVLGINWVSPASGSFSAVFYTRHTEIGGMVSYRKPPHRQGTSGEVGVIGEQKSIHIDLYRISRRRKNTEKGPPKGCKVQMVFEVGPHNIPHPDAWLRLPTTCLFEDAPRAMTLAIRIEWTDAAGNTRSEYLKSSHFPVFYKTTPGYEGQYDTFGVAIGILNYLENKQTVGARREFVRYFGTVRILNVSVNHLRQLIQLEIISDPPEKIVDAGPRNQAEIHRELRAAGAENINQQFGTFIGPVVAYPAVRRKRCDRCQILATIVRRPPDKPKIIRESNRIMTLCAVPMNPSQSKCEKATNSNRCTHCEHAGIDCTYTLDVFEKPELMRALCLAPYTGDGVFSIDDADLMDAVDNPPDDDNDDDDDDDGWDGGPRQDTAARPRAATGVAPFGSAQLALSQSVPLFPSGSDWKIDTDQSPAPSQRLAPAPIHSAYGDPPPSRSGFGAPSQRPAPTQSRSTYDTYEPPAPPSDSDWELETKQLLGFGAPSQRPAPSQSRSTHDTYQPAPTYGVRTRSTTLRTDDVAQATQSLAPSYSVRTRSTSLRDDAVTPAAQPAAPTHGGRTRSTTLRANTAAQAAQLIRQDSSAGQEPAVLWAKPLPRKRASDDLMGYHGDNAFQGQMDPSVPNSAMASQSTAQLIRDIFLPLWNDLRQSRRGTGTRDMAVARIVARFRDMGSLFLRVRLHNLIDAGDWIAQKVYLETAKDLWVGNSEKDLKRR
jgi:hypothetical protein